MMQPFAGIIANQMTKSIATSALPDAPVRPERVRPEKPAATRRLRRHAR
jgi:hypothetical protein